MIFAMVGKLHVLHPGRSALPEAFILTPNHISHFDPPLISVAARRGIDWLAMTELFERPWLRRYLLSLGAIPTNRARVERATLRTAMQRLQAGHAIGVFPEGGLRTGPASVLEGAPLRPGAATLAEMAEVPVVPCVVLGTDRLYAKESWWPPCQLDFWVGFGEPIRMPAGLPRHEARARLEREMGEAIRRLCAEMRSAFGLRDEDLPQTPQRRKGRE